MKQALVVGTSGQVAGLQPRGAGVDLRRLGNANISRVSDIVWHDGLQRWRVKFLRGKLAGKYMETKEGPLVFDEYKDAVAAEIDFVNLCINNSQTHLIGIDVTGHPLTPANLPKRILGHLRAFWGHICGGTK